MKIQNAIKVIIASAALTAVAAGASFAQNLTPGGSIAPTITTVNTSTLITSATRDFTSPVNNYSGTAYSAVYNEGAANSLGGLTFVFQVRNNASSTEDLDRLADFGFAGYSLSGFYSTQAGGLGTGTLAPGAAFETVSGGAGFRFEATATPTGVGNLTPGLTTDLLVIRTNANSYTTSTLGISDATTVNVDSFRPATSSAVPEPATLVPFALGGLGLLGLIVRKTRRTGGAAA